MATIVLGGIGAAVGSAFGGPAGARLGWSIGTTIGSLVDSMSQPGVHVESGKLSDLKVSGSSYGTVIPQVWGSVRCPGNIIWATDLQEHSHSQHQGKGGGGASSTAYTYSVSFAVAFCRGTTMLTDGALVKRNVKLVRLWADDMIVWDVNSQHNAVDVTWYDGSEAQPVDPAIAAYNAGLTPPQPAPAYRGTCYALVKDMDLTNFSNRIPNLSAEVATDIVTVGNIAADVFGQVGLRPADYDVSACADSVTGYTQTGRVTAQDALSPVLTTYLYDLTETDGLLRPVKRGGAALLSISPSDLGASIDGGGDAPRIEEMRSQDTDLPGRVDITYFSADPNRHFEQFTQGDDRQASRVRNAVALTLPLTLAEAEARQIAARHMDTAWTERDKYLFRVPPRYAALTPADPILLPLGQFSAPVFRRVRLTSIETGLFGEVRCEAVADDISVLTQTLAGGAASASTPITSLAAVQADFTAWSGTELRDSDLGVAGFYVAATAVPGWTGAAVYYSPDNGATWVQAGVVTQRSVWGRAVSALAAGAAAGVWDKSSTAGVVTEMNGLLGSTTEAAVLTGQNIAVIGPEILGFATATLTGEGQYTLSDLERGLRGSAMTGHASGERFVLATEALTRVSVPSALAGQTVLVKCVSAYQTMADVAAQSVVIATPGLTPAQVGQQNLQNQINALAAPITGTAISPPPYWQMKYLFNALGRVPVAADFAGAPQMPFFASGAAGDLRFETPGLALNAYWSMKLKNVGAAAVTVNWSVPAVDNFASGAWNGASLFSLTNSGTTTGGTFSIAAGSTGLLELFYANTNNGNYNTSNQGTLWFLMDALLKAGVQFVDAATGQPPTGTVQQTDINNWNAINAEVVAGRTRTVKNVSSTTLEGRLDAMEVDIAAAGSSVTVVDSAGNSASGSILKILGGSVSAGTGADAGKIIFTINLDGGTF